MVPVDAMGDRWIFCGSLMQIRVMGACPASPEIFRGEPVCAQKFFDTGMDAARNFSAQKRPADLTRIVKKVPGTDRCTDGLSRFGNFPVRLIDSSGSGPKNFPGLFFRCEKFLAAKIPARKIFWAVRWCAEKFLAGKF